jgi:hypothetical protein
LAWHNQKNKELSFEIKAIKARLAAMPEGVTPEETLKKEETDKKYYDSMFSYITPVPKSEPSPRKFNVSPATTIPAMQSYLSIKDLQQSEVNWNCPLDVQTDPPWENPLMPQRDNEKLKQIANG